MTKKKTRRMSIMNEEQKLKERGGRLMKLSRMRGHSSDVNLVGLDYGNSLELPTMNLHLEKHHSCFPVASDLSH